MFEPLALPFMQRAIVAALLTGLLASYYAPFVVQRQLAFLGNGLAHAAFGGVALGLLLGVEPLWVAMPFTVGVALGIVWMREHARLAADTTIGVFFALSMALGVIFLSLKAGYAGDAFAYLFGSVLAVSTGDLWAAGITCLATLATLPLWGRWAYATFDPKLARSDRVPVLKHDYLLAAAIAVAVVVSIKVIGILLVSAFLVLPAAVARVLAPTFARMAVLSMVIGGTTAVVGLYASYFVNVPSGPAIILLQGALLIVALGVKRAGGR